MKTVTVAASKTYDVHIGSGLLDQLGSFTRELGKAQTACLVSETNVYPLFGEKVVQNLENAGLKVVTFVFPAGEESKNPGTYLELLNFLAASRLTRSDLIFALGGGVTGAPAGFAAATYLR